MARLTEEFPNLHVVFKDGTFAELNKLLEQHQVDYVLYSMDAPVPDTEAVILREEPILVALPENHPCCAQAEQVPGLRFPTLDISCLNGQKFILPQPHQSLRIAIQKVFAQNKILPAQITEISHFAVIMRMVSQGMGIGFNREGYLDDLPATEGIRYCYLGNPPICSQLVLLYPRRKKYGPYHDRLIGIVQENLSGEK